MEHGQTNDNGMESSKSLFVELHDVRSFDSHQKGLLGKYVYALRDPRDNKVFYVGQGTYERVLQHFRDADEAYKSGKSIREIDSRKLRRILDIWLDGASVEWAIIATNLDNSGASVADTVESAVYDAINWSINGPLMNEVAPPGSTFLESGQIVDWAAQPVSPNDKLIVFLCNIGATHGIRNDYDSTRMFWSLASQWRARGFINYGVGLVNGISKAAYEIDQWLATSDPTQKGKFEFEAMGHPNPVLVRSLVGLNWRNIYRNVGYWQYGRPIIVEFDGNGHFRILLGAGQSNGQWAPC